MIWEAFSVGVSLNYYCYFYCRRKSNRIPEMMSSALLAALLVMVVLFGSAKSNGSEAGSPEVPGMFVFGDSLIDVGNNNYLDSVAKSNYWPYGCDFSEGPTGRFCNGKTVVDLIGELLGMPYLPAFADPTAVGARILGGVNYASAAAGILDETGRHWVRL
ncbi:hypothetical protein Nepgr_033252 [Nepenthes gracilis]|uniref:GDSL esterase/lipase n=1 Tax=Nepenthes gracilis TaxID=150966 RepID=A0AAD3Y8J1_NEPGR|nr:hypothetical protein Nepgr_033252 [Nepenthes gracilis]